MTQLRSFLFFVFLMLATVVPGARADDAADARQRYNEGRAAMEAGRYREAALAFEAAVRLRQHGAAAFAAATAWDKAEQPARAADNYARSLELPGLGKKDTAEAKTRLETLEKSLGIVEVKGPAELVVQFQGSTEAHPPVRLHAPPGIQTLLVARDGKIERRDVMLKLGEMVEVDVTDPVEEPPPAASSSAPPPPPPPVATAPAESAEEPSKAGRTRKIIGYSAMGAGVVSAGVAVALGFKTMSARDEFNDNPTRDNYDSATSARLWTNVGWAGAVVLGGVGAVLVFYPWEKKGPADAEGQLTVSPAPGGVVMQGAF